MRIGFLIGIALMGLPSFRRQLGRRVALLATSAALAGVGAVALSAHPGAVQAQGTPSLMEFRWDNTKDYRKLYYFMTYTERL